MKRSTFFTGLAATAAVATAFGALGLPSPAQATPPDILTSGGSDTTEFVMEEYMANPAPDTGSGSPNPGLDNGRYNLKATYGPDFATSNEYVPGDAYCGAITYAGAHNGPIPPPPLVGPPNGSGAGKTRLNTILSNGDPSDDGCLDISRSSSARGGSDPATFEYYGYGMDIVTWSTASSNAPPSLTRDQLIGIYSTCLYNDWSQVGGSPGPIQRVLPNPNSGTRPFFEGDVLGGAPSTAALPGPDGLMGTSDDCPAMVQYQEDGVTFIQEHAGQDVPVKDFQTAINIYGVGPWNFQANTPNPTLDRRGDFRLGQQTPVKTFTATLGNSGPNGTVSVTGALNRRFTSVNIGATVTGAGIPAGTKILSVSADNLSATLSQNVTAGAGVSITVSSLAAQANRWITAFPGGWIPNNPTVLNPRAPVTEALVRTVNNSDPDYRGVRYIWNVLDTRSPSYTAAFNTVAFDNIPGGSLSPLCDAGPGSDEESVILNNGFAPLPPATAGTDPGYDNSRAVATGSTCRKF